MRILCVALLSLTAVIVPVGVTLAETEPSAAIPEVPWLVDCSDDRCFMQILIPFDRGHGTEQGGLAVAVDRKTKNAIYIAIFVPGDAVAAAGLTISFVDHGREGEEHRLRRGSDFYALPMTECTMQHCVSRVHQELDNGDGTSLDLLSELQRHAYLWVAFKRANESEPVRILIPTSRFKEELAKVTRE